MEMRMDGETRGFLMAIGIMLQAALLFWLFMGAPGWPEWLPS